MKTAIEKIPIPGRSAKTMNVSVSLCQDSLWLFCEGEGCGERQMMAFGHCAHVLTREKILIKASSLGWAVAPKFLCVNCKSKAEQL